jgi:uncharacterized coiled-coil protein SlyX
MEVVTEGRTEGKLEELSKRVDEGFTRMDEQFARMDRRFERVDERFERVDERFESLQKEVGLRFDRGQKELHALLLAAQRESIERQDALIRDLHPRFDAVHRSVIYGLYGTIGVLGSLLAAALGIAIF